MRIECTKRKQNGAILVVSLLLLLVMTVLALSASNATRMQERMAGNSRDLELAFQGAEAALRDAERDIDERMQAAGGRLFNLCTEGSECPVDRPADAIEYAHQEPDWWEDNAKTYGDPAIEEFDALAEEPVSRAEFWTRASDSLTEGAKPGQQSGTAFYVSTARSVGGTETAEVILQSTYAAKYTE